MSDVKREWFDSDYYATLGVDKSADQAEITKAYRALARKLHPDANPGNAEAEEKFKEVSSAYDVLGDEDRRRQYDQVRRMGPMGGMGGMGGGAGGPGAGGFPGGGGSMGDLGDILGSVLGGGLFGGPQQQQRQRPAKGANQQTSLSITFDEAVTGMTTDVVVSGRSGERKIKIKVPAGIEDGKKIRLKGQGGPGAAGGPSGDLLVQVAVESHPIFGRDGANLTIEVPITFVEAALGADLTVPTFSGSSKKIRVPGGTNSGAKFRLKGEGVATTAKTGNLIVTVIVHVPAELSEAARAQLEAYAELTDESPRDHLGV